MISQTKGYHVVIVHSYKNLNIRVCRGDVVSTSYETALICLNGHVITIGLNPVQKSMPKHCVRCGERTISECPNCHSKIRGYHRLEGVVVATHYTVPLFCHDCGKPYPWTETKLNAVHKLIEENRKLKSSFSKDLKL